jgi:hypothetical protein
VTVRMPRDVEISVPYPALVETLAGLDTDQLLELIKDVEDHFCEWELIVQLKAWVDRRHKVLAQEEAEEQSRREDRCIRSAEYEDIWVHTSPHKGCVLR